MARRLVLTELAMAITYPSRGMIEANRPEADQRECVSMWDVMHALFFI
ncbi:MAG: hypothetical protein AAFR31_20255 [Cyanobacteria bacterium J06627_8]